jgi:lipid II isoglutaminyl synthase (glutamine-hydrolysing)
VQECQSRVGSTERSLEAGRLGPVSARLSLETAAARLAGSLSRTARRGGGTTLPGKLLWKIDPGAVDALAARLPEGSAVVSATNGKTTTTAMAAAVLGRTRRLAWNNSGANLASGVASTLLHARDADLGLFEVDEFALPEMLHRVSPRAVVLGNLFRDQLDRYGELEHIAERWRAAVRGLSDTTVVAVCADDPLVASLVDGRPSAIRYGVDDPSIARASLQHAADSKYCIRCGTPYDYAAAYVGHLGDYRCPACDQHRPTLDLAARDIDAHGLDAISFTLVTPSGERRVRVPLPGLYNVYNALAASSLCQALGAQLDEIVDGLSGFRAAFGRFERVDVAGRRVLLLLIKNPAGANEAVRTLESGGVPATLVVALNDAIADGRDVSWIWDVDFEPLLHQVKRVVVSGDRAAELALRFTYGGLERERIEVVPDLEAALDRGLELVADGEELAVLPTYTAMLRLRSVLTERGLVAPYWKAAA